MNPETIRVLGWCLLHFVWQGAVLALALSVALPLLRSPRTRYGVALCALAAMMLAPVLTFLILQQPAEAIAPSSSAIADVRSGLENLQAAAISSSSHSLPAATAAASTDWLSYAVLAWVAGVYMFTLRTLGAWMLLMRLRRQRSEPIGGDLLKTCLELQQRLGVTRAVSYVCSKAVESPAVLGWLRPVVVLPLAALAGLTPWQIEAIIAHELAHIRRLDAWVNVLQIATETLLFYHPAVWWVNRVIRNEREHCCDDVAVEACGNAPGYARALALLEESRSASALVLAANGGALTSRIGRLLGVQRSGRSLSAPSFAVLAALSIAGALMAGTAATQVPELPTPPAPAAIEAPPAPPAPSAVAAPLAPPAPMALPAPMAPLAPMTILMPHMSVTRLARLHSPDAESAHRAHAAEDKSAEPAAASSASEGGSYISGLQAAGLKDLTVDEIIALKIHQVTPEYVRALHAAGLEPSNEELLSLKIQGVTPEFVRALAGAGLGKLLVSDYLVVKVQGITPEFIEKIRKHGFTDLTLQQLIALKHAGID